mmetsp:Transcript_21963/g.61414  ORF Transcript_21963/g.61414 Transcript_21963/m.61414 type:complete len:392 (+) Transcript_21963:69-1244(+)
MPQGLELSVEAPEFKPGQTWTQDASDATRGKDGGLETACRDMLRRGFWNMELRWWMPFYLGKLKSFNMRTGYGFIECESTEQIYHMDVYIHKSQMMKPWRIGQPVEFAVTQNNRGQPQATDVFWLPMTTSPKTSQEEQPVGRQVQKPASNSNYIGTVKSYSATQAYGFIASDAMLEKHSCDVYLDRGQLPPSGEWRPGQVIEFEVAYNRRGQPQARSVNWDPVPFMRRDLSAGTSLRTVDTNAIRNLNEVLAGLRDNDRSTAVKRAMEFQNISESIDYLSFVLDRLGEPSCTSVEELSEAISIRLILLASTMLRDCKIEAARVATAASWCEASVPVLSRVVDAGDAGVDTTPDSVIRTVLNNVEVAVESNLVESPVLQPLLAQLHEISKEL